MRYLRNPTTGEVKITTRLTARSLTRYGWLPATREDWITYQRAQVQSAMLRHIPATRRVLGRVQ